MHFSQNRRGQQLAGTVGGLMEEREMGHDLKKKGKGRLTMKTLG